MEMFVSRHCILSIINKTYPYLRQQFMQWPYAWNALASSSNREDEDASSTYSEPSTYSDIVLHLMVTTGIWLLTVSISFYADQLGVVSALTGAVAASMLGYILPGLIHHRCRGIVQSDDISANGQVSQYWYDAYIAPVLIAFGGVSLVIGVATILTQ